MRQYKIVASDLDGTLLNSAAAISRENAQAIKELSARGVHFVPSTGRAFCEIQPELAENPHIRYISYSNGAAIWDKLTGEHMLSCMSRETAKDVLDIVSGYDTYLALHQGRTNFTDARRANPHSYAYYRIPQSFTRLMEFGTAVDDFNRRIYELQDIEMICAFFRDDGELEECRRRLQERGGVIAASSDKSNLEIFSSSAGKGNGLKTLAAKLGVDIADTIGVGDSANDLPLLQAAGLSLAMGNAWDELKQAADQVICTNDEHAVEYILKSYFPA